MRTLAALTIVAALAAPSPAALVDTHTDAAPGSPVVDGVLESDEYGPMNSYQYRGGGGGFGGTVGNGTLYMKSDEANLYIAFEAGADLNDIVTIMLDTRSGGYTDAEMDDQIDGGRRAVSNQSANADDAYDPDFLPDFGIALGNFGTVVFETRPSPEQLNFISFDGSASFPVREIAIPLATLGITPGDNVDFFVAYIADSGFGSNESIPAYDPLNNSANPGFDPVSAGYGNYDRFVTFVPQAELHVFPNYTGSDCCFEFMLTQKWGAPGNITRIDATVITSGVTVASASNPWSPPPTWTSTMITWITPTPNGLWESPETVEACFDTNGASSVTIVFQGFDSFGNTHPVLLVDTVIIDTSVCPPPVCGPTPDRTRCQQVTCPIAGQECLPTCITVDLVTGASSVTLCECRSPNECHAVPSPFGGGTPRGTPSACTLPDNGTGTVTLPPAGCEYLSPEEFHMLADGLPPGTEIIMDAIHKDFICGNPDGTRGGADPCATPGGTLGGDIETFTSTLQFHMTGTGALAGFDRTVSLLANCEVHTGPRNLGDPVQSFANDMVFLSGELFGDPDFCLLRVSAGTALGLPSPGQTTLTRLPSGDFQVDSFFDIAYSIQFQGCPGGALDGLAGTTTGTVRMQTGLIGLPQCVGGCPPGTTCARDIVKLPGGLVEVCCRCEEDCNGNGIPDSQDIADGNSADLNANGIPDECESDCNMNGIPDFLDIINGTSSDCNNNGIPDECEDFLDCNGNGVPDPCDIANGTSLDCNLDGVPDECDPPCAQPTIEICYNGGCDENCMMTLPTDPAFRSAALNAAFSSVLWKNFDDTTSNRAFGHTFANLPAGIVGATLEICMRPHSDIPSNDGISLGLVSTTGPVLAWGSPIRNLPGNGGTWNNGEPCQCFVLDLAALPKPDGTCTSILSTINARCALDIYIQDDTAVDYMRLRVWTCPPPVYCYGLPYVHIGQATATPAPTGLVISNIGSSGQDGVSLEPGDGRRLDVDWLDLDPAGTVPDGAYMTTTAVGFVDDQPDQVIGSVRVTDIGQTLEITADFSPIGSTSHTVEVRDGGPEGKLVAQVTGHTGPVAQRIRWPFDGHVGALPGGGIAIDVSWRGFRESIAIVGGPTVVGDYLCIKAENPTAKVDAITNVVFQAADIPEITIIDEALGMFGRPHRALGEAVLEALGGELTVANIGSSGLDGFSVDTGDAAEYTVHWQPLDSAGPTPDGAYLEASATGLFFGNPGHPLGRLRVEDVGAGYDVTPDFSDIGSSTHTVEVVNNGVVVATFNGHTGTAATASSWPVGLKKLGGGGGVLTCYVGEWPPNTIFTVGGTDHVGNELRVLAEGSPSGVESVSSLSIVAADIPEITLTGASVIPSGCVGPELDWAHSVAAHKTGGGTTTEFYVDLDTTNDPAARTVEPRNTGYRVLEFQFNQTVTAASLMVSGPGGLSMTVPMTLLPGESGPSSLGRVDLGAALPNDAVYTFTVVASTGPGCDLAQAMCVGALVGDFNGDQAVSPADKAALVGFIFQPINQGNATYDLQVNGGDSGTIEVSDLGAWTGFFGTTVAADACPTP